MSFTELQEQLGMLEEAGISILQVTQQGRNENGQQILMFSGKEKKRLCIASWARWNAQLKRSGRVGKEVSENEAESELYLSEKQEIFRGMVEGKIRMQSRAAKKYHEQLL